MINRIGQITLCLSLVIIASCVAKEPPKPTLVISPVTIVLASIGSSASFQPTLVYVGGRTETASGVSWKSSNPEIATINTSGQVTAMAFGQTVVTATYGEFSDSAEVIIDENALSISGLIRYEDKEYSTIGLTGNKSFKPVRFAIVELVNSNNDVLLSTVSDANGFYELAYFVDRLSRVRVVGNTSNTTLAPIVVTDYDGNIHASSKSVVIDANPASMDIDISTSNGAGVFNIIDVFTYAQQYVEGFVSFSFPELKAVWQEGSSDFGTTFFCFQRDNFCTQGQGIYLLGGGGPEYDTDEFDDDVIWHEFGHYLAFHLNIGLPQPGVHNFTSTDLDLRLAWNEGFSDFFPTAIKTWLEANNVNGLSTAVTNTSMYIDTGGPIEAAMNIRAVIDISNPPIGDINPSKPRYVYSASEIAVANVMYHMLVQSDFDTFWNVYAYTLPSVPDVPTNLEAFWDAWLSANSPDLATLDQLNLILSDRKIYYKEDDFETSDQLDVAYNCNSTCAEIHYLYRNNLLPDHDFVTFDASAGTTYVIETSLLFNGADTTLRLYDPDGFLVAENDNRPENSCCLPNNSTTLSSKITYQPSSPGKYRVLVLTTPNYPPSAGRYGSFLLSITFP